MIKLPVIPKVCITLWHHSLSKSSAASPILARNNGSGTSSSMPIDQSVMKELFNLISTKCAFLFQNSIFFFENSVDPDPLASDEAS